MILDDTDIVPPKESSIIPTPNEKELSKLKEEIKELREKYSDYIKG